MSKPVQLSMKHLREHGWTVAHVEKWIPARGTMKFGVRKDVWGFGDLLGCLSWPARYNLEGVYWIPERMTALIQATDSTSHAKHKVKILAIPEFDKWKRAGNFVLLHSWSKRGPRGKRKVWTLREEVL